MDSESLRQIVPFFPLQEADHQLIETACEVLRRNYLPARHTVAAAVRCPSGSLYTGVNVEACGYGPCAEPVALGAAFTGVQARGGAHGPFALRQLQTTPA